MEASELYEVAKSLDSRMVFKLVMQAESEEERKFYAYIMNMNLQRGQRAAIENENCSNLRSN